MNYLTFEFVMLTHDHLIEKYGGVKGLLSESLLKSALEMPKANYGGMALHKTIFDKAAAYLFHLIQNHPFIDGNKRTASLSTLIFFASNFKGDLKMSEEEYQDLILKVAQGIVVKKEISAFFRKRAKKA